MEIKYKKKLGTFSIRSHLYLLIPMFSAIIFTMVGFWSDYWGGYLIGIVFLVLFITQLYELYLIYRKQYSLEFPDIHTKYGHFETTVSIPTRYTIIISSLALPIKMGIYETYAVKGRVCVSIISENDISLVYDKLHQKGTRKYSNCTVETNFKFSFVDSFIYDEALPTELWKNADRIVIPESCKHSVNIVGSNVFYDIGY